MKGLNGKRFIVGGGSTGIGAAVAKQLVQAGASVAVGDINESGLKSFVPELQKVGKAIAVHFDLSDKASVDNLVEQSVSELGGLDGVAIPGAELSKDVLGRDNTILDMEIDVWERSFRVNLLGHALLMKAAIPHLEQAGGGSIVSVSSGAAFLGLPTMPAYSATKAGLQALVRHVARVVGKRNIRCNGVSPGPVLTDGASVNRSEESLREYAAELCMPRPGLPDDLASTIVFLLSDESAWLTGQTITVNGGYAFRD